MPIGRKPEGDRALTNAERQARHRARRLAHPAPAPPPAPPRPRRPVDRRSRPQQWRDAVAELIALQAAYAEWLDGLPDSLRGSPTAEALEAIADLDLTALAEIEPPRGFGRD